MKTNGKITEYLFAPEHGIDVTASGVTIEIFHAFHCDFTADVKAFFAVNARKLIRFQ